MPDTFPSGVETQDDPDGPGGPVFIPISLTADVADITAGSTVTFTFTMDAVPSGATYSIGFYSTQSQPSSSANAASGNTASTSSQEDLPMTPISIVQPGITPTSDGGSFTVTFAGSELPTPPVVIIVTISINNENSLGLCSLSYT